MEYRKLMTDFAAKLGLADLAFTDDGEVCLSMNDVVVSFLEVPERRALLMWSEVAEPPQGNLEKLYEAMFDAMFMGRGTGGATFSREGDRIWLQQSEALVNLDAETLAPLFDRFVSIVGEWRGIIRNYRPEAASSTADGIPADAIQI